jgi:hypothetical protein
MQESSSFLGPSACVKKKSSSLEPISSSISTEISSEARSFLGCLARRFALSFFFGSSCVGFRVYCPVGGTLGSCVKF